MDNIVTQTITEAQVYQFTLFHYIDLIEMPEQFIKFKEIVASLPLKPLITKLENIRFDNRPRGQGRNDYPIMCMLLAYLGSVFFHKGDVEALRREMKRNRELRLLFGFNDCDPKKKHLVPPSRVFTNLKNNLKQCLPEYMNVFMQLVVELYKYDNSFGRDLAIDGKYVTGAAKHKPREEKDSSDGRRDCDATYSKKKNFYRGNDGTTKVKEVTYYGYRIHIICDVKTELPVAFKVTPAHEGEQTVAKDLIVAFTNFLNEYLDVEQKIDSLSADKGYDGTPLIKIVKGCGIIPIIDIRNTWKDGEKTKQYKDTDYVYTYDGEVYYVADNGEYIRLKYVGYDKSRDSLRYQLDYEGVIKIIRIEVKYDERIFTPVARDSKKFERLYNGRTSVERLNGRLDRDYGFEVNNIRGLEKMNLEVTTAMILMLANGLWQAKQGKTNYASLYN